MALIKKKSSKKSTKKKVENVAVEETVTKETPEVQKEVLKTVEITEELGGVAGAGFVSEEDLKLLEQDIVMASAEEVVLGAGTTRGLDISVYQRGLSLQAVKNAGYDFVILRAGFTGWGGDGTGKYKDDCFEGFYAEAKRVGLKVGAYWYSCADNATNGRNEARYMIDHCLKGKQFELPIAMDVEDSHHQIPAGRKNLTDAVVAFCEELENSGYYANIYANPNFFNNYLDQGRLTPYDKWLALWNSSTTKPSYMGGNFGLWQNSSSGSVGGYRVDTNYCYKDYAAIMKEFGLNGFAKTPITPEPKPEPTPTPTPEPKPEPTPAPAWPKTHVVKQNETLSGIAAKYYGNGDYAHYMFIANANNIPNPNIIHTGQKLTIPEYKTTNVINKGDKVKIIAAYASSSTSKAAYNTAAIGWERVVMEKYDGRNYPYAVGDGKGVTGFCKAEGLKKL